MTDPQRRLQYATAKAVEILLAERLLESDNRVDPTWQAEAEGDLDRLTTALDACFPFRHTATFTP